MMRKLLIIGMLMCHSESFASEEMFNKAKSIAEKEASRLKMEFVDETLYSSTRPLTPDLLLDDCVEDIYKRIRSVPHNKNEEENQKNEKDFIRKKICEPWFSKCKSLKKDHRYWFFEINGRKNKPNHRGAKILFIFVDAQTFEIYSYSWDER